LIKKRTVISKTAAFKIFIDMNLIKEVNKPTVTQTVVIYGGRFQPFHRGHYAAYENLCSKFGKTNVYIGTSNDTSSDKSPFSFKEKKEIATKMFGVPAGKFVKVNNPYRPIEILSKFDGKTTQYIAAVGEKDASRLKSGYFKPYKGKAGYGYDEVGYYYTVPAEENPISGTDVRKKLGSSNKDVAKKFFLKAYPTFDKDIFKMITTKLNEDGMPGGIGVGLVLPGGYINGAPTGSVKESNNTKPSYEMRPEPHPTRHEREHPSDEPDWHKKNEPYDPISELIERYITNEMFEEFTKEYFGEATNKALDVDITYTNSKGQQKKIKARDALRLPKEHPAHIQASKIAGPDDAPANEPKTKEEPGKATQKTTEPPQAGQPVKKDQTAQGKMDKEKGDSSPGEKGQEQGPPPEQKLGGAELKSNAEKSNLDKIKEKAKELAEIAKNKCKAIIKDFSEEEQHDVHEATNPHSETRKSWKDRIGDFVSKLPKNIAEKVYEVAKSKAHQLKNTGRGIRSLVISASKGEGLKFGYFKDSDGKWKHSEHEAKKQKKACLNTLKDVAIIGASVVTGGAIAGAAGAAVGGGGIGAITHAAIHGASHSMSTVGGFLAHAAVDFAKHCGLEAVGLAAGAGHSEAVIGATGAGLGTMALKGMGLMEEVDETKAHGDMFMKLIAEVVKKMENFEPNPHQLLKTLESYKKQKEVSKLQNLTKGLNESISESKENSINHFVEYATKKLKLSERPKITLLTGREYSEAKTSLGGYNPMSKEIYVAIEGRLTADILRTLAHEMVHRKQDELGLVKDEIKDSATGSSIENQAHTVTGILMRNYGKINKQIYNEATDTGNHGSDGIHNNHNVSWKEYDNPAKGYVDMLDGWEVKGHLSDDLSDEILNTKLPVNTHIDPKKAKGTNHLKEDINVKVDKGDTVLMGKFKNKKVVVKDFGKDDHGMPTINGKVATTFRMGDKGQNIYEMGSNDIHFKNIIKYFDKGGPNIKKQVSLVVCGNKTPNRNTIIGNLRDMGYDEITGIEKKLGIEDLFEKKNLREVSNNTSQDGVPDGAYVPKGKKRKLDGEDGVNKSEDWFTNGGYTQTQFPKADAIFGDNDGEERTVTYSIKNLPAVNYVETEFIKEGLLMEGGAYGHMSHPFDDMDLTFGDLKNIISKALEGDLGVVREKTDGQALAISWKNGRLIAARNKGHLQNAGANAMGIEDVASKFGGRGGLTDAYNYAMKDLSAAISGLSDAQRKKIFNEGKCFMNLEVIWPTSVNVIPYGQALLVFHNTTCYDETGKAIGADGGAAGTLAGMIKQVNADVQSKYTIQGPPITSIPKNNDLSSKQSKYLSKLSKLQSEFGLKDNDNVADYHQSWWEWWITSNAPTKVDKLTKEALVRRWAFGDKSFRLNTISNPKLQDWAIDHDKVNVAKQQKDNIKPFEEIFLGVGADILEFVSSVLTVHPDNAIRSMKSKLKSVADQVRSGGSPAQIQKLKTELQRLNQLGGIDRIVASEGLVFFYNGKTYKLTGTFAPLNQILGIFYS